MLLCAWEQHANMETSVIIGEKAYATLKRK